MALAIANKDQKQANDVLSDAVGIALMFGLFFGAVTYFSAPSMLQAYDQEYVRSDGGTCERVC